jgi:hypothetical protein
MVALFAASCVRLHLCYVVSAEGKKGHDMKSSLPNNLPESNRRRASPLSVGEKFGRAVHARTCMLGGSSSANRWATPRLID